MIDAQNVIRMKINLNLEYNLAHVAHMYICKSRINSKYEFVKCQTLKPYMIINNPICHYIDEEADIARNPFRSKTRIDCDKVFRSFHVGYSDSLLTTDRSDICDDLFQMINDNLEKEGFCNMDLDEGWLVCHNNLITFVDETN